MDKGQRLCGLCGRPLSIYNTTGQCFSHAVDVALREDQLLLTMVRNPQPEPVEQNTPLYVPKSNEQGEVSKVQAVNNSTVYEKVCSAVARLYDITTEQILEKNRSQNLILPRQVVMYLLNKQFNLSLVEIGGLLSRDHTTILYGVKQVGERIKTDENLKKQIESFGSLSA